MNNIETEGFRFPLTAEVEAMVVQATRAGNADAERVSAMCSIAGKADMIPGFLLNKASARDVSAQLLRARVDAEAGTELITSVMPGCDAQKSDGSSQGKAKPWKEILKSLGLRKQ